MSPKNVPINKRDLGKIKQELLRLRSELQEMEETVKETGQPVELDQARVGRLSRMDAMQAQQMSLEAARRRQQQLLTIEGALRRIESGEYGYCFVCGNEIDVRRLAVDPANTRCMGCVEE
jgi:DnaK suppressor protein